MELRSELALRVYKQVFLGIDKPLGYTLERDESGAYTTVSVPDNVRWYVRHHDDHIPDWFVAKLATEVTDKGIPGLSLASCQRLADAGFASLRELGHLETLDLFNTNAGDKTLELLAKHGSLSSLNLAGTRVTDAGLSILQSLPKLRLLHLGWTDVTDAGLARLVAIPSLEVLVLRNTRVSDEGMKILAGQRGLRIIDVQETKVGDAGVKSLLPLAPSLTGLYLGYTSVTDASMAHLLEFSALRTLMLRATHLDRGHDAALRQALTHLGGVGTGPDCIQEGLIR